MVNVQQTFNLSPRASHLLERLCSSQHVLSSLQHLMAGSTCWLLTAVNMCIRILVRMLSAPLPAAITSSLPFLRQGPQCLCLPAPLHRGLKDTLLGAGFFPRRESAGRVADDIAGMGRAGMCLCSDAAFARPGGSKDFYITSTPGGNISCCSARDPDLKTQTLIICSILQNSVSTDLICCPFLFFLLNQIKYCYYIYVLLY